MNNWPEIQTALQQVFSKACQIPFVWNDEPRCLLPLPFGLLALGQSLTIGRDCSGYTFRNSNITLDIYGYRELTITVQVFSRKFRGEKSARFLIEKARLSLANPEYREELKKASLVFVECHPVMDLAFSFQNRAESRSAFDVVFRLLVHEQISSPQTGYFDSVIVNENFR